MSTSASSFPMYGTYGKGTTGRTTYDDYSNLLKKSVSPTATGTYGPAGSGVAYLGYEGPEDQPGFKAEGSGGSGGWWGNLSEGQQGIVQQGIGAGVGLLGSFLAPDTVDIKGPIAEAQTAARKLGQTGEDLSQQGTEALAPVMRYLAAMTSGDPQAILAATAPDRRKILDQYDTARQMAQFGPRGGGTASATIDQNTREASDLALLAPMARTNAMKMSADLGSVLSQTGAQAESAAAGHMANLLTPIMQQKAHDEKATFDTFASIAKLAMMVAVL